MYIFICLFVSSILYDFVNFFPFCCAFYRDIKGANLLVDSSGVVKLADFGMAKHVSFQVLMNIILVFPICFFPSTITV